jgi:hypothetical protein
LNIGRTATIDGFSCAALKTRRHSTPGCKGVAEYPPGAAANYRA